jgi:hypothetical protein
MPQLATTPVALRCPRCSGPMFPQAAGELDYLCLMCGEYRFLVRKQAEPKPVLVPEPVPTSRRKRSRKWYGRAVVYPG